jgi:ribonucleoside-triphosphate reductase
LNTTGVEIGMLPVCEETGESGWQMCNLTEINGGKCTDKESMFRAAKSAAILGTLQAGYTDFKYLSKASQRITERESLIGVSITGWMNNPDVLFDEENMKEAASIVKAHNKFVADIIGINQAARTTTVKPSGNASVLLGTASGIHGEHSEKYFRHVQINEQDDVLKLIQESNPKMVEKSVWSNTGTDYVVAFPVKTKGGSIYKKDLLGVKQLEYVKKAQQTWISEGKNTELCTDPTLSHNVSNTITVDDWDEVEEYIYKNRDYFAGISLLSSMGDKGYTQAPFTEVFTAQELLDKYGDASMFASGLIVDGMSAFNDDLWKACDTVMGFGEELDPESSKHLLKRDWVRRAKKFADNFFAGEDKINQMTDCLKDCYNLHKWNSIENTIQSVDFSTELDKKVFVDVDTLGAQGCSGGACEINF